jgi:Acetyltransferase (GNAT) domain
MDDAPDLSADLFRIDWNRHSAAQWQTMLDNCARPTLTQSPAYAAATAEVEGAEAAGVGADFGLIRFQNKPIGMTIVTRRRTFGGAASCSLYRGPLWIYDDIPGEMLKLALRLLRNRHRWWRGRPLTFHPEIADSRENRRLLGDAGFRRVAEGYATIWLDLSPDLDTLRANLRSQWRNKLTQAEGHEIDVIVGTDDAQFEWLYGNHASHMAAHGYRGPSPELLRALRTHAPDDQQPLLLIAQQNGQPIAGVLLTVHGKSATYLVGWSGDSGRRLRAHNLLLWRAVERLKQSGIPWLDLGGINTEAPGVADFKRGMGGELVNLVGGYV